MKVIEMGIWMCTMKLRITEIENTKYCFLIYKSLKKYLKRQSQNNSNMNLQKI
jgi:hypothetical protein